MAAYDTLRAAIDNYIKANGNKEITGTVLNDILNAMVSALGADTRFAGVAVPSTNPGNPEGNVVYFASQAGTYSNFGGIVLPLGIHILVWNGTAWTSQTWFSVDSTPTQNSQNLATSGGILQAIVDAVGVERLRAIGAEVTSCSFDSNTKKISFFNSANNTLFQLDATAFVIDGMVSDVKVEDGNLVIQFNTDAGKQDIEIPLTDIFNPANYYTKTATDALLNAINNKLADGYLYRGMAEPTTNPPTPTTKVFYIATKAGTYTNFGNIAVTEGITILKYDGSNWSKEQICYSDGVFDISAYNGTSYADLSTALGTNGANIPQNLRKGGMSVKFVQSSDNKYVQYRLMHTLEDASTAAADFANTANWQGVDDEPTAGSDNLIMSGGVSSYTNRTTGYVYEDIHDNIIEIDTNSIKYFSYIRDIHAYVKDTTSSLIGHKLYIFILQYYLPENRLYIRFYDTNTSSETAYLTKDYASKPSSGVEYIELSNSNVVFTVTIDWSKYSDDLAIDNQNSGVYLLYESIDNYKKEQKNIDYRNLLSLSSNNSYMNGLDGVKRLEIYVPSNNITDSFIITELGYYSNSNKLYMVVRNETTDTQVIATKSYISKPTYGLENVSFIYDTDNYKFVVTIDWEKFSNNYNDILSYQKPIPVIPLDISTYAADGDIYHNGDFASVIGEGAGILRGSFTLNTSVTLSSRQRIVGINCIVNCGENAKITLSESSSIDGIKFVGNWNVSTRTQETEHLTPLICENDLKNEYPSKIFGVEGASSYNDAWFMRILEGSNAEVTNCIFSNFKKIAVLNRSGGHWMVGNNISNNLFLNCWCGVAHTGEFLHLSNNTFERCMIGLYNGGGNNNRNGNIYKLNDCGIYYPSNVSNGAHGESVGEQIVHSGVSAIYIKEILSNIGDTFTGFQIADGPIIAENCSNLLFVGGRFDTFITINEGHNNGVLSNLASRTYCRCKYYVCIEANSDDTFINSKYRNIEWIPGQTTAVGEYVSRGASVYKCLTPNSDTDWDTNKWEDLISRTDSVHEVGDYLVHYSVLYKCTEAFTGTIDYNKVRGMYWHPGQSHTIGQLFCVAYQIYNWPENNNNVARNNVGLGTLNYSDVNTD